VGKQIAATRRLPFQLIAELVRGQRQQYEILLARKMLCRGRAHLAGGGKVDEPVTLVIGRTMVLAERAGEVPVAAGDDLVNVSAHDGRP
jgi:hypothetical protein